MTFRDNQISQISCLDPKGVLTKTDMATFTIASRIV